MSSSACGSPMSNSTCSNHCWRRRYRSTVRNLLAKLIAGAVIHADETNVNLQKGKGYVWVLANTEEVVYLFKPSREGEFLHELLKDFAGVLITDFFSAYDSLPCDPAEVPCPPDPRHEPRLACESIRTDEFKWLLKLEFGKFGRGQLWRRSIDTG